MLENKLLDVKLREITKKKDVDDLLIEELQQALEVSTFDSVPERGEQAELLRELLRHGAYPIKELRAYFAGEPVAARDLRALLLAQERKIERSPFVAFIAQAYWDMSDADFLQIIRPACYWESVRPRRVDHETVEPSLRKKIRKTFKESNLFIADLTGNPPSVYYELGYFDAKKIPGLCLSADTSDIAHYALDRDIIEIEFGPDGIAKTRARLREALRKIKKDLSGKIGISV